MFNKQEESDLEVRLFGRIFTKTVVSILLVESDPAQYFLSQPSSL